MNCLICGKETDGTCVRAINGIVVANFCGKYDDPCCQEGIRQREQKEKEERKKQQQERAKILSNFSIPMHVFQGQK